MTEVTISLLETAPDLGLALFLGEEVPDQRGIKDAYVAGLVESLFLDFWTSYFVRSYGGHDDLGNYWDALSPVTVKRKRHDQIMRRHDRIMASLWPNTRGLMKYFAGENQLFEVSTTSVSIGTLVEYAGAAEAAGPGREIIPSNWESWLPAAIEVALERSRPLREPGA